MRHASKKNIGSGVLSAFGADTALVLLFLAMEYGRAVRVFAVDGILLAITMGMVLVLPYFLPSSLNAPAFTVWMVVRTAVILLGLVFGAIFSFSLGLVLPESLKQLPMTFLILASMISCYVQYYGLMRLRLAK